MSTNDFDPRVRKQEGDVTVVRLDLDRLLAQAGSLEEVEEILTLKLAGVRNTLQKRQQMLGEFLTGYSQESLF